MISIHALLAESDRMFASLFCGVFLFLSTLSLRRATRGRRVGLPVAGISIHALLAESDKNTSSTRLQATDFYPRSPCGERLKFSVSGSAKQAISIHALLAESDPMTSETVWVIIVFLSTLSLRRATYLKGLWLRR